MNHVACKSLLDNGEKLAVFETIDALENVGTPEELMHCTEGLLKSLLPHRAFVCGVGKIGDDGGHPCRMLPHDFPGRVIEELTQPDDAEEGPWMQRWRATRKPVLVERARKRLGTARACVARVKGPGFKNAALHGMVDVQGGVASYFCFIDVPQKLWPRHAYLLTLLVPNLHAALMRAIASCNQNKPSAVQGCPLSERQKDVLRWMCEGKSYWAIGQILGLSENTIKYHAGQIFAKLAVSNRTHAALKAFSMKLIETPS